MGDPAQALFKYASPSSPTLQDIVMVAEGYSPGTTWIAAVEELAVTGATVPKRLERTEWPTLSSEELVGLLSACPPLVEAEFEAFGEYRNAYWMTIRVADGNWLDVNSSQHEFIRHLR